MVVLRLESGGHVCRHDVRGLHGDADGLVRATTMEGGTVKGDTPSTVITLEVMSASDPLIPFTNATFNGAELDDVIHDLLETFYSFENPMAFIGNLAIRYSKEGDHSCDDETLARVCYGAGLCDMADEVFDSFIGRIRTRREIVRTKRLELEETMKGAEQ